MPVRQAPGPGQESVWDYPRPPRVERSPKRIRVDAGGRTIAESTSALRVLETSHPPVYYLPREDIDAAALTPAEGTSYCEFKGVAHYLDVAGRPQAAWYYPQPSKGYEELRDMVAFYPGRVDGCWVDDEKVQPQPGQFYGGWITADIVGPVKGGPGTQGW